MLTVWAKSSAFVHAVTHVISWKVNKVFLTWCWNISQITICINCTNCDKMKWRICADCDPRGQAQVKFATRLWLFKCCTSPDISTCWNPWLVNCCWAANLISWKTWHYVNCTGHQCTQRVLPALYTSRCTFDLCKKMQTSFIPFVEIVSYQVKALHVLRHVPFCLFRGDWG